MIEFTRKNTISAICFLFRLKLKKKIFSKAHQQMRKIDKNSVIPNQCQAFLTVFVLKSINITFIEP